MKAQDIAIFDGVGDGVGVQLFVEDILGGLEGGNLALHLLAGGVGIKYRRAGEAEELGLGKERLDGLVVLAKL